MLDALTLAGALHRRVGDPGRVDAFYAPIGAGCLARLERHPRRPWVLGIQGPQGCGKSALSAAIAGAFGDLGLRAFTVSIDDFYLTHCEQTALAARYPDNPYLRYRGYPGTHDVELGARVLDGLADVGACGEVLVPRYSKGANAGRGDRAPSAECARVAGPLDVLVIEGWMLGFTQVDPATLEPDLRVPNALLAQYAAWTRRLDAFVRLDVASLDAIVTWRVDAERARRAAGEVGLSDEEARDYIERFLPAYRAYLPGLRAHPPCSDVRAVLLGHDRMPVVPVPP